MTPAWAHAAWSGPAWSGPAWSRPAWSGPAGRRADGRLGAEERAPYATGSAPLEGHGEGRPELGGPAPTPPPDHALHPDRPVVGEVAVTGSALDARSTDDLRSHPVAVTVTRRVPSDELPAVGDPGLQLVGRLRPLPPLPPPPEREPDLVATPALRPPREPRRAFDRSAPPVELEALERLPELAGLLDDLRESDRLIARALPVLGQLHDRGDIAQVTGVGLRTWLAALCSRTGADVRMLLTAGGACRRFPALAAAFAEARVSWSQVRAVALMTERFPRWLDDAIDAAIARPLFTTTPADPDSLVRSIRQMVTSLDPGPSAADQRQHERREFLALQPRPDGTGGTFHGDAGPEAFAVLDAAVNRPRLPGDGPGRTGFAGDPAGGTRADAGSDTGANTGANTGADAGLDAGSDTGADTGSDTGADRGRGAPSPIATAGRERLRRLIAQLDADPIPGAGTPQRGASTEAIADTTLARRRPQLLIRADLDLLLDRSQVPAALLTSLLGGVLHLDAATTRRLLDERGADLRTIIVNDTGAVLGVGRRTRVPPGWLRDAVLVQHETCTAPTCDVPVVDCELDHATPWHPARPHDPPGRTDITNLGPLCRRDNAHKEADGWVAAQLPDGTRRWTHPASSVSLTSLALPPRPPDPG